MSTAKQACVNALFDTGAELERREYRTVHQDQPTPTDQTDHDGDHHVVLLTSHQQQYRIEVSLSGPSGSCCLQRSATVTIHPGEASEHLLLSGSPETDTTDLQSTLSAMIRHHILQEDG
ncbi:hypothetical protein HGQ17_09885 [Nesterenkonia sp. MY13]|uniref:Uncharacterized protein n=1 Tax=Nesterenkonia sedimenti TaxID=1463632 RepID=A0A7X8TK76_9MICC|nr:hypothetical protein [Nesterenkonia sedimenti]NLS10296.1 hypothetical protein [Nesterenkonia sedimenti]